MKVCICMHRYLHLHVLDMCSTVIHVGTKYSIHISCFAWHLLYDIVQGQVSVVVVDMCRYQ